jgi:excisionase family DNA binding protein
MKSNRIPRLLAVTDIADLLRVSIKTVRRWIDRGDLRAHHLGRCVRVSEEDLNAFLAQHRR